jgi:hypothetical protein
MPEVISPKAERPIMEVCQTLFWRIPLLNIKRSTTEFLKSSKREAEKTTLFLK